MSPGPRCEVRGRSTCQARGHAPDAERLPRFVQIKNLFYCSSRDCITYCSRDDPTAFIETLKAEADDIIDKSFRQVVLSLGVYRASRLCNCSLLAGGQKPAPNHVANVAAGDSMDSVHGCSIRTGNFRSQVRDNIVVSCRLQAC